MIADPERPPEHVLLVSLPFGAVDTPSLALGLLQAHCARDGTPCDTEYLTIPFAERVGLADYHWVTAGLPYTAFVGEWVFAEALYGPDVARDDRYVDEVLQGMCGLADADLDRLRGLRAAATAFLDEQARRLPRAEHTFLGLTSTFQQNLASLAFAKRVKARWPDITVACGGANWEEPMGRALLDTFPFVDLAFSGEADRSFPQTLRARREQRGAAPVAGVTGRRTLPLATQAPPAALTAMDELPVPDYAPYFRLLDGGGLPIAAAAVSLPVETSRGCWWGARSHCTFCGLNGSTMTYRSKTPDRVLGELTELRARHGTTAFSAVDNILDQRYLTALLPRLADGGLGATLFWEVKANLSREQVRTLRAAGTLSLQPGIESLSDHVLTLIGKGTTALRNVELLKWCQEYGVVPLWNLLYGFPGETADDYAETVALITAIWHLYPPMAVGPVRLDRFSPYHTRPAEYGITNVRPLAPIRHLYPDAGERLDRIAYYFDFDYADGRAADTYAAAAVALAQRWIADRRRGALIVVPGPLQESVQVIDTRTDDTRSVVLTGWQAAVYRRCDRSQRFATLAALPAVRAAAGPAALSAFLDRCVADRVMAQRGGRWLSLAVHSPPRGDYRGGHR